MATTAILPLALSRAAGLPFAAWSPLSGGMPRWAALENAAQNAADQAQRAFDDALQTLPESPLRTQVYNARRDFFQRQKMLAESTLQAWEKQTKLAQVLDNLRVWEAAQAQLHLAEHDFGQALRANYQTLQDIARDETLRRALLFASHDLLQRLPAFAEKSVETFDKKDRQTALSLSQYLARATFKTSPLSRFTTVQVHPLPLQPPVESPGEWGMTKAICTPNVALLPALYEVLLREPAFFRTLNVRLNPCVTAHNWAGIERATWLYFDGEREAFQRLASDPVADFVVEKILENHSPMRFVDLLVVLESEVEADAKTLQDFVFQLVDIGLLEWALPERGLLPSWCGSLYNYLGYLPSAPVLTEAAYLLQWLRTAARTLPFQPIEAAQATQREAVGQARAFFERHDGTMPPIEPAQIFFEDVAQDSPADLPAGALEGFATQVAECWRTRPAGKLAPFRARVAAFAEKNLPEGQTLDFLAFSQLFFEKSNPSQTKFSAEKKPARGKIGALLQVFWEDGQPKAVLNALYPGGGKMFARWLHLFPSEAADDLKNWAAASLPFPWQGWSNANFQPPFSALSLAVPDGRVGHLPNGKSIALGDLAVHHEVGGIFQLIEKQSNTPIFFHDLGLESPDQRPPAMHLLWHLGMPDVSLKSLLDPTESWSQLGKIRYRKRVERGTLVLARAAWEVSPEVWQQTLTDAKSNLSARVSKLVRALEEWGIPRFFFARFDAPREKPQFFDQKSPISMILLEKTLRGGAGYLLLNEMLPSPTEHGRATEWVLECEV